VGAGVGGLNGGNTIFCITMAFTYMLTTASKIHKNSWIVVRGGRVAFPLRKLQVHA